MSDIAQTIRLQRLTLSHFKGVASLDLSFEGQSATLRGANGTGKTTVVDAFHWLLFGKDSANRKDFGIKTWDRRGKPRHNLTHSVEALLAVDGQPLVLKKAFAEKWTKKRGQAKSEFTGHSTSHFIDGVPVSEKDYAATIAGVIDEDVWRLLTSPTYFNEALRWQDRRQLLLRVVGDLTDTDVIASNPVLADLPTILAGRALEDHRKVVESRRRQINQELAKIPVRIDEAARSLTPQRESPGLDVAVLRTKIAEQQAARQDILSGGAGADTRRQLREVEAALLRAQAELTARHQSEAAELSRAAQQAASAHRDLEARADDLTNRIAWMAQEIDTLEQQMIAKREAWRTTHGEVFEAVGETVCAACGQALPADQIQAAYDKALAAFNREKSDRLEAIQREGRSLKERQDSLRAKHAMLIREQKDLEDQVTTAHRKKEQARAEAAEQTPAALDTVPEYQELLARKEQLAAALAQPTDGTADALAAIDAEIAALQGQIDAAEANRLQRAHNATTRQRIADLEAEEKTLTAEFEALEHQLYLMDQFTRTKVNALEQRINAKFAHVSFKLFTPLVNGGLEETAITQVDGVPYPDLNHAAKIQAGLEIINVLSAHYGLSAPVFVDGHESISRLPAMATQVIRLTVDEAHETLSLFLDSPTNEKVAI